VCLAVRENEFLSELLEEGTFWEIKINAIQLSFLSTNQSIGLLALSLLRFF
jgi:hypothetical protein